MSETTRSVILRGAAVLFTLLIGTSLLGACASTPAASTDAPPLQTVAKVDLSRYTGTWHEIARYPFGIQDRRCARDTTATYRARTADTISVLNRCVQADGTESAVEGVAWILDPVSNAKLEVSFLPAWLRWLPIGRGDYWVIDLAPDYSWVVVGEPRRRYLWILARSPRLDPATYEAIVKRLPTHGYDPARLLLSPGRR
jgi:apolipoprotein D and lipocalin family protein